MNTGNTFDIYFILLAVWFLIQGIGLMHPKTRVWLIKFGNMLAGRTTKITAATTSWHIIRGMIYILVGGSILYVILILKVSIVLWLLKYTR